MMTISLRLDPKLARRLEEAADERGISKSALIRNCLEEFLSEQPRKNTPWELGKHLFGRFGSERSDLAANHKQIFREKLHGRQNSD